MSDRNDNFWSLVNEMYLLSSSYAQRWISLLDESQNYLPGVTVDDIRDFMLVEEQEYKQKSDLLKRVVYDPIHMINNETNFTVEYTYLYGKRRPVLGFNVWMSYDRPKNPLTSIIGPEHLMGIKEHYKLNSELFLKSVKYPLTVAALFQAHRDIRKGKVRIEHSSHLYMMKVMDNSLEFLSPLFKYTYKRKIK